MNNKKTYECRICWNVNHSAHFHCSTCGTVPAKYSMSGKPRQAVEGDSVLNISTPVVVAHGAERQVSRRTIKRAIRTVPADYYAPSAE